MKRLLLLLLVMLALLAGGLAAGLFLAPDRLVDGWTRLGLPLQGLEGLARLAPAGLVELHEAEDAPTTLLLSGFLEAEQVAVAAELGGPVVAVLADEGQTVNAGQPLVRLDDSVRLAELKQAEQAVAAAQAALDLAQAGPRQAEIDATRAQVQQAQAALDGARQALADAEAARDDPQELIARINAAQSRVALAQRQIEVQQARQAVIRVLRESVAGDGSDQGQTQRQIYDRQQEASDASVAAAQAELQGAQRALGVLRQMRANLVRADVQVRAAEGQVRLAEQALRVADKELALASAGPRAEDVAVALAELAAAEAAREVVSIQLAKTVLTSPLDGVVLLRSVEPGETALAGAPLLQVGDLSRLTVTIYVPLERIGEVQIGQPAQVSVDAYPGRAFAGHVTAIASRAEFTPKNVLDAEERSQAVFAVTVTLDGDSSATLKPGMPADVLLAVDGSPPG